MKLGHLPGVPANPSVEEAARAGQMPPLSYAHPNCWALERFSWGERVVLAPSKGHVKLLCALAQELPGPFRILYVLVESRTGREPGRYQSSFVLSHNELTEFLAKYEKFLEEDGRHHLWVASSEGSGSLIYDRHEMIYGYGPLGAYSAIAALNGLTPGEIQIPFPHVHSYQAEWDEHEVAVLTEWDWVRKPLIPEQDE